MENTAPTPILIVTGMVSKSLSYSCSYIISADRQPNDDSPHCACTPTAPFRPAIFVYLQLSYRAVLLRTLTNLTNSGTQQRHTATIGVARSPLTSRVSDFQTHP